MADPNTFGAIVDKQNKDTYNSRNQAKSIKDLAYKAFIVASEQNILVEAWLPETLMLDVSAKYDAPYEQGLGAISALSGLSEMARFLGLSLTTQAMTAQIWQGGSFIDLSIPLIFQAEENAALDVMLPIKQLLSLTMPKDPSGGGFLTAPGPRIDINRAGEGLEKAWREVKNTGKNLSKAYDTNTGISTTGLNVAAASANQAAKVLSSALVNSVTNNISLYIGQFLYFPSVVITDVSPTYDVILGKDKNPLRATVNVGIRTFYMPTSQDIDIMFPATKSLTPNSGESTTYGY
jgi:hypothetical protein